MQLQIAQTHDTNYRRLSAAAGLAVAIAAAVGALAMLTVHATTTAMSYLPPGAVEFAITEAGLL